MIVQAGFESKGEEPGRLLHHKLSVAEPQRTQPRIDLTEGILLPLLGRAAVQNLRALHKPPDTSRALSQQLSTNRGEGKVKSGFMLRRHLATAPPLRLGSSAAWPGKRGGVED